MKSVSTYEIDSGVLPNMQYHVFISKQTTKQLSNYIVNENWGIDNVLLYKYLDYIWRFQLIDKQIKLFKYKNENRLVFHTGLIKKDTNDDVFICLIPNKQFMNKKVIQSWRVAFTSGVDVNESFLTKKELMKLYKFNKNELPLKTDFYKNKDDAIFYPNYKFIINLDERVRTTKQRILNTIKNDTGLIFKDDNLTTKMIKEIINNAINISLYKVRKNVNLIGKQVFIERDIVNNKKYTIGYHLELLLPLTLNIHGYSVYFAMILRANHNNKTYEGMSIITREMAYSNSRLVSQVTIPWLKDFVNTNTKSIATNNNNRQQQINMDHHATNGINFQQHIHEQQQQTRNNNNNKYNNNINDNILYLKAMQYFMFGNDNVGGLIQLNQPYCLN